MTPARFTVEVMTTASGYAVGLVVGDRLGRMHDYPEPVAVRVTPDHAAYLDRELAAHGGMPPVIVTDRLDRFRRLHALRYAAWYRVGLPALRLAARHLPLHYAERLADRYRRLTRYHSGGHLMGGGRAAAYLVDRFDQVSDAEGAIRWTVAGRARQALARVDRAAAIAHPEVRR